MNIKKLCFKTKAVLVMVCAVLLLCSSMAYAGDGCEFIKVIKERAGGGSSVRISPEKITVPVGTCTVWINFIRDENVQVSFRENAKQCILATDAATGFQEIKLKTGEACYYSETLSHGKTASLLWSKPGIYKYTLEIPATTGTIYYVGDIQAEGVIEVK
jgi:hypothetical protein